MIRVERTREPAVLRSKKARRERRLAAEKFGSWEQDLPVPKFEFKVYRDREVKRQLEELFHRKCAYCEARYRVVTAGDVEHFRPKRPVIEEDGKTKSPPGYWWLASDWDNLLPSCPRCNRYMLDEEMRPDGTVRETKGGKGSRFPLLDPGHRATKPRQVARERPLLLHPCQDDPKRHLEFTDSGLVRPRAGAEEKHEPKGAKTIEVCALNRYSLVQARREALEKLLLAIASPLDSPERYVEADQPFAGMSRQAISSYKKVRRLATAFFDRADRFDEDPDNEAARRQLKAVTRKIKGLLDPHRADAKLARSLLELFGVPLPRAG